MYCVFFADRSENMIKNEYMKLSRDASQRRKGGHESDSGAEGEGKKVWTDMAMTVPTETNQTIRTK